MEEITINLNGKNFVFFYRPASMADNDVIVEIFRKQTYNLAPFLMTSKLLAYSQRQSELGLTNLIVDAGANIGASVVYFHIRFPDTVIFAIEPEKGNIELLKINTLGLDRIKLFEGALGCDKRPMFLYDPGRDNWGFMVQESGAYELEMISMNQILEQFSSAQYSPFICKIDIEGGEKYVFEKNLEWMTKFPLIIIELHDGLFPGTANSKNLLKAFSENHFDFVCRGKNAFCFNIDLLQ